MIKLLTFSTLYPNAIEPQKGIFVENRLRHLLASGQVEVVVVAPVPWFPFSSGFGEYSKFAKVPAKEQRHGITLYHPRYPVIPKIGMSTAPLLMAMFVIGAIKKIIAQGYDFDIIDAHYFYPDGISAALISAVTKKPYVVTARGTDINLIPKYWLPRKWILWAAKNSSAMVTVCQALKDEMVSLGMAADRITPLRNGVDLNFFHPGDKEQIRQALNISGKNLLSVGYLIERKGHHLIIDALQGLSEFTLYIVGDGELDAQLKQQAMDRGLGDRVVFLGALAPDVLRQYMVAADALILASSREGMANVLLESIACGTPVVATPLWGTPEVVAVPEAGVLTAERSVEAIMDGVKRLFLKYPNRADTRKYAETFSWNKTTQGQLEIFNKIIMLGDEPER